MFRAKELARSKVLGWDHAWPVKKYQGEDLTGEQ